MNNENKRDKFAEILELQQEFIRKLHEHDLKNMTPTERRRVWNDNVELLNSNQLGHHFISKVISKP